MQITWLPLNICDLIDRTTRDFIWKNANHKGLNLVSWDNISRPKVWGGLGIRMARDSNIALLGKLVWDLLQGTNKHWVSILSHKYTSSAKILNHSTSTPSSITWNSIIKAKNILKNGFSWRAGSGESSFWYSHWTSFGPLCANDLA